MLQHLFSGIFLPSADHVEVRRACRSEQVEVEQAVDYAKASARKRVIRRHAAAPLSLQHFAQSDRFEVRGARRNLLAHSKQFEVEQAVEAAPAAAFQYMVHRSIENQ